MNWYVTTVIGIIEGSIGKMKLKIKKIEGKVTRAGKEFLKMLNNSQDKVKEGINMDKFWQWCDKKGYKYLEKLDREDHIGKMLIYIKEVLDVRISVCRDVTANGLRTGLVNIINEYEQRNKGK